MVKAIYGRKVLNFFSHWLLKIEIYEGCFILVGIYYSKCCRMFFWVDVGKDSV